MRKLIAIVLCLAILLSALPALADGSYDTDDFVGRRFECLYREEGGEQVYIADPAERPYVVFIDGTVCDYPDADQASYMIVENRLAVLEYGMWPMYTFYIDDKDTLRTAGMGFGYADNEFTIYYYATDSAEYQSLTGAKPNESEHDNAPQTSEQFVFKTPLETKGKVYYEKWTDANHTGDFVDVNGRTYNGIGMYSNISFFSNSGSAQVSYAIPDNAVEFSVYTFLDGNWCATDEYGLSTFNVLIDGVKCYTRTYKSASEVELAVFQLDDEYETITLKIEQDWSGNTKGNHACVWGNPMFTLSNGDVLGMVAGESIELSNLIESSERYVVINESMTWQSAKSYCEQMGGHLVTITSQEEQTEIERLISINGGMNAYWIGLYDDGTNKNWQWLTGETVDYTNWRKNEPSSKSEIYAEMYGGTDEALAYLWNDSSDSAGGNSFHALSSHGLICEFPNGVSVSPRLSVDAGTENGLIAGPVGGRGMDVNISSNTEWRINVIEGADWIQLSASGGVGDGVFYTQIASNAGAERTGWIELSADNCDTIRIRVVQGAAEKRTSKPTLLSEAQMDIIILLGDKITYEMTVDENCYVQYLLNGNRKDLYYEDNGIVRVPLIFQAPGEHTVEFIAANADSGAESEALICVVNVSDYSAVDLNAPVITEYPSRVIVDTQVYITARYDGAEWFRVHLGDNVSDDLHEANENGTAIIPLTFMVYGNDFEVRVSAIDQYGNISAVSEPVLITCVPDGLVTPDTPIVIADNDKRDVMQHEKVLFKIKTSPGAYLRLWVNDEEINEGTTADDEGNAIYKRGFSTLGEVKVQFTAASYDLISELSEPWVLNVKSPIKRFWLQASYVDEYGKTISKQVKNCFIDNDNNIYASLIDIVDAMGGEYSRVKNAITLYLKDINDDLLTVNIDVSDVTSTKGKNIECIDSQGNVVGYAWINKDVENGAIMVTANQILGIAGFKRISEREYKKYLTTTHILNYDKAAWELLPSITWYKDKRYISASYFYNRTKGTFGKNGKTTVFGYNDIYGGQDKDTSVYIILDIDIGNLSKDTPRNVTLYSITDEELVKMQKNAKNVDKSSLKLHGSVSAILDSENNVLVNVDEIAALCGYIVYTDIGQGNADTVMADVTYRNSFDNDDMHTMITIRDVTLDNAYFDNVADMEYNHDIAKFALALTCASNTLQSDNCTQYARACHLLSTYRQFGFDSIKLYNFDKEFSDEEDSIAFSIASRSIGNGKKLVSVVCRGNGYGAEWVSNANVGAGGDHRGFEAAARQVFDTVKKYLSKNSLNANNSVILFTGFSRSAAVANYAAHLLNETEYSNNGRNVCAYCFATPLNTIKSYVFEPDENIFNILNPNDLVTLVPFTNWGFNRFGKDITLPAYMDAGYKIKLREYEKQLDALTGVDIQTMYKVTAPNPFNGIIEGAGEKLQEIIKADRKYNIKGKLSIASLSDVELMAVQYEGVRRLTEYLVDVINRSANYATGRINYEEEWKALIQDAMRIFMLSSSGQVDMLAWVELLIDKILNASIISAVLQYDDVSIWSEDDVISFFRYFANIMTFVAGNHRQETYIAWMNALDAEDLVITRTSTNEMSTDAQTDNVNIGTAINDNTINVTLQHKVVDVGEWHNVGDILLTNSGYTHVFRILLPNGEFIYPLEDSSIFRLEFPYTENSLFEWKDELFAGNSRLNGSSYNLRLYNTIDPDNEVLIKEFKLYCNSISPYIEKDGKPDFKVDGAGYMQLMHADYFVTSYSSINPNTGSDFIDKAIEGYMQFVDSVALAVANYDELFVERAIEGTLFDDDELFTQIYMEYIAGAVGELSVGDIRYSDDIGDLYDAISTKLGLSFDGLAAIVETSNKLGLTAANRLKLAGYLRTVGSALSIVDEAKEIYVIVAFMMTDFSDTIDRLRLYRNVTKNSNADANLINAYDKLIDEYVNKYNELVVYLDQFTTNLSIDLVPVVGTAKKLFEYGVEALNMVYEFIGFTAAAEARQMIRYSLSIESALVNKMIEYELVLWNGRTLDADDLTDYISLAEYLYTLRMRQFHALKNAALKDNDVYKFSSAYGGLMIGREKIRNFANL